MTRPKREPERKSAVWVPAPHLGWPQGTRLVDGWGRSLISLWWCDRDPLYGKTNHYRAHLQALGLYIDLRAKTLEGAKNEAARRCLSLQLAEGSRIQSSSSWVASWMRTSQEKCVLCDRKQGHKGVCK